MYADLEYVPGASLSQVGDEEMERRFARMTAEEQATVAEIYLKLGTFQEQASPVVKKLLLCFDRNELVWFAVAVYFVIRICCDDVQSGARLRTHAPSVHSERAVCHCDRKNPAPSCFYCSSRRRRSWRAWQASWGPVAWRSAPEGGSAAPHSPRSALPCRPGRGSSRRPCVGRLQRRGRRQVDGQPLLCCRYLVPSVVFYTTVAQIFNI